jgi:alkylation response protein AidB-like acyl-CoA dehydrogenase
MNFNFTEEQLMIRDMIREFTQNEVTPLDEELDKHGFSHELYEKMKENGLMGIHFPEKYGGAEGDAVTSAITVHELAKGSASIALFLDAHWLAADTILYHGTEEQKEKYLYKAATESIFSFALTEPCAGSDAAGIKTTAKLEEDEWVLNGNKAWITNAGVADVYVVLAKTDPDAGAKGISAFIIEKGTPGFSVGKEENKMGMRGSNTAELILDNVRIPKSHLLGKIGSGFKIAMIALDGARISIGAIAAGLAEHAMKIARDYANERYAFGKPIAKLYAIQEKLADMAIGIEATELMTYSTAKLKAEGKRHTKEAAMVKVLGSEMCMKSCSQAIQVLGGYGYSREYHVERFLRDAKLLEIGEGTSEILRMVIGNTVLAEKN